MAAIAGDIYTQSPTGRTVTIEALDELGGPAAAEIDVFVSGASAGTLALGTGSRAPSSLEISDGQAEIALHARFLGQVLTLILPPSQDHASFRFSGSIRFATGRKPVAYCPDGSSGSPCVTCHGPGGLTWRMCC